MRTWIRVMGAAIGASGVLFWAAPATCGEACEVTTVDRIETEYTLRNQAGTSLCWLHSDFNMMEQMAAERLSIDAILIPEIQSRALARFLGHETPWDGGAGPTRPFALALEHGLVPESVWKSRSSVVQNYHKIFLNIEKVLEAAKNKTDVEAFLTKVNAVITKVTGSLPPTQYRFKNELITAVDYARKNIGSGASIGWDFRNIKYNDSVYGRLPEVAWTTIISRDHQLIKITDVIKKIVHRVTADEAFARAVRIFEEKRPVAFTFVHNDGEGKLTYRVNEKNEYEALMPAVKGEYTSSHLVLIVGVIRDSTRQPIAFEILDSLGTRRNKGIRILTKEFFYTHGKTVHEVGPDCTAILRNHHIKK